MVRGTTRAKLIGVVLFAAWNGFVLGERWRDCGAAFGQQHNGWVSLFNGKDLTGWKVFAGKPEVWGVEDGILYCKGGGGGWLMTEKQYSDFELRFEFRLPKMGNSGVALRASLKGNPAYEGMEIQLLDDENWKGLRPEQYCGAIYDVVAPKRGALKPAGEWNTMHICAHGKNITIVLNGQTILEANLEQYQDRVKPDPKGKRAAHPGLLNERGHIGFQSYNHRVDFRNIQLRELPK
ncbi:MAG: DUF1080 domain-containing protein [Gemmatales bacterium]|nr:DUF1080 domain-containing protein [Gemmatales bacterium]MDW7995752.1 DUF1080 domain-containing protein [Gemmatales bacterium]